MSDRLKFKVIGLGTSFSGEVYVVTDTQSGQAFALKFIIPFNESSSTYFAKMEFMTNSMFANSKYLLRYYEAFADDSCGIVLLEYCEKDNLEVWMRDEHFVDESVVISIGAQIIEGLSFLEKIGISHGNIEPRNIYMNDLFEVKLANYGIETNNSYGFNTAEVMKERKRSSASDIFATGCTMYYLVTHRVPFNRDTEDKYLQITDDRYSGELKRLIYSMMNKDPSQRPTIDILKDDVLIRRGLSALPSHSATPPYAVSFEIFTSLNSPTSDAVSAPNTNSAPALDDAAAIAVELNEKVKENTE